MADIKIDMVKPTDLPQMAGPLSILEANYNDMSVVKYPSDLGITCSLVLKEVSSVLFKQYTHLLI